MAETRAAAPATPGKSRSRQTSRAKPAGRKKTRTVAPRSRPARRKATRRKADRAANPRSKAPRKRAPRGAPAGKESARSTSAGRQPARTAPARKKPTRKKPTRTTRTARTARTARAGASAGRERSLQEAPGARRISERTQTRALTARIRELESHLRAMEIDLAEARGEVSAAAEQRDQLRLMLIQKEAELQHLARRSAAAPAGGTGGAAPSAADLEAGDAAEGFALIHPPGHAEPSLPDEPVGSKLESDEDDPEYEVYDEEADFLGPDGAILERRRQLDRERAEREIELGEESFWMVCPRCGEHLTEHEFDSIKVERCEACGTLCVDRGEIELLLLMSADDRSLAYRTRGLLQ